jgi:hypothetical protein
LNDQNLRQLEKLQLFCAVPVPFAHTTI